ncbi:MAG TPA: choice-of-anchor D domain-containing protein [Terriglobia bacterium]|nr:choice-of-anchor D domain-containing protein [Terriglobia bacterium]
MRKLTVAGWLLLAGLVVLGGWDLPVHASSNPVPFIQGLSPVTVAPPGAQFTLTVSGSNFESTSVVQWNGSPLVTVFVGSGKLTATVPTSDLLTSTTANVTVMNPGPPSTVSNVVYFTVTSSIVSVSFTAFQHPGTGQGPFQPVVADFNGDGKPDLAISDQANSPGTVTLILGNGDGTFQTPLEFNVGSSPKGAVAGDFNGDGIQDLAVINSGSATVTILFGSSTNPFSLILPTTTSLPSPDVDPFQVAAADFNGDGNLDLAVTCQTSGDVVILLGNGDGTFGSSPASFGTMAQPAGVAVADFNGDGKLDLAVADAANNEVWILSGNGDGTFSAGTPYATATSPEGVAAGDFNADGNPDLAVADLTAHEISILMNSGSGTFSGHTEYASPTGAFLLLVADLNGDGVLDLAVTTQFGNTFNVLLGTGGGAFAPALSFTAGSNTTGIAGADFVGDGQLDLAVTNNLDGTVSILKETSQLTFNPSSLTFPSQLVGTRSTPMTLTMTNTGDVTVTFFSILGNDPTHFLQTNTCGTTLAPNASCTFSVTFSPTATGLVSSSITLRDDAPGNPQSISLSGTGAAPIAALSPASLAFSPPSLLVGSSSSPQAVTLSNTGNWALTIGSIQVTGDYSQTNNCAGSLNAGANCTLDVTFKPTATGTRTGTLTVSDNSNAIGSTTQTTSLTGTAIAPVATLTPGTLTFSSQNVGTTSAGQIVTLTNAGSAALAITLPVKTSGDFGNTTTCGATLNAGASCSITVTFTPTASGTRSGSLTVTDNSNGASGTSQTVTLTGTGLAPVASLAPASLTYTAQAVGGTSAAQTITLSNTGSVALIVTSITGNSEFVPSQNCVGNLSAGSTCPISIAFSPATNGNRTGTLTVSDNSIAPITQTATLTGTGLAPEASFAPTSLTFSSQGVGTTGAAQTITLTNNGSQALAVNSVTASGDFAETTTCGASLAAGANCTITVTFKPTAAGTRSGTLSVTDNNNNAAGTTQTLALTGTGTVATASLSLSSLTFASQAAGTSSAAQTITLSNTGSATLSITSIATGGADGSDFTASNTCNGSVAVAASCLISVTFKPAAGGARAATLTVTDNNNGAATSTQSVTLSGTGNAPAVQLSASTLTFTSQNVGTTSSVQDVTITNQGTASLSLISITASGDFSQSSACGTTLGPGAACTVTVMFKPSAPGSRTGALSLSDNASPSTQTVSLTGTGIGPEVSISPASLAFGGELLGATSAAQTIKLTNAGNAALSVTNIAAGGDFSETNNCAASLAAAANCTVTVTFKPGSAGSRTGTLTLTDGAGGSPQIVSLTGTGQDFSLTASSTSASISSGQTVTYTLSLNPLDGLHQAVSLSCSGAPSGGNCTVTPSPVTPSGATTVKVTVTTAAASAIPSTPRSTPPAGPGRGEWLMLSLLGLAGMSWLRRRQQQRQVRARLWLAVAGLAAVLVLGMSACGGGSSSSSSSSSGTPAGTYNLTVTGTATSGSTTVTHDLGLTLQVQ